MKGRARKSAILCLFAAGFLILPSCAGEGRDDSEVAGTTASRVTASQPAPSSKQQTPAAAAQSAPRKITPSKQDQPLVFNMRMVRSQGVTKQNKGGQSNVRFVAGTNNLKQIEKLAIGCVKAFLRETKAAFCYAYANQADYDVRTAEWTPDWDETIYGAYRPCYALQAAQALADDEPSVPVTADQISYDSAGCPGGVKLG